MVPVELELQNFLSYGTDAPTLNFESFRVACLSGKNGQGKSALLDAMTWAVWGEARKSSGRKKPDEDLIRIGTQHMEVTFTFDLEGDRYRVSRSFYRSSSGKTTQPGLEFQVYAPEDETYRPLTGGSMRETQEIIDRTLGLDYDTFINSAFLLQGRSDEFTQKRPSARKEILANVLNLGRYEALEDEARTRWRKAKQRQQQAEQDIERLEVALEDVDAWREDRDEVDAAIEDTKATLQTLRQKHQTLTERRADINATLQEAEAVEASLEAVERRIDDFTDEAETLQDRIEEAEALIDQQDTIEAQYEQYEQLQEERDVLDEKRDLYRGIEKQIDQKQTTLKDRTNEIEKKLHRLEVKRETLERELNTCEEKLQQRAALQKKLQAARDAKDRCEDLEETRRRHEKLEQQIVQAEQAIRERREVIRSKVQELAQSTQRAAEELKASTTDARIEALEQKVERRRELQEKLNAVQARGKDLTNSINADAGQLDALQDELETQRVDLDAFRASEADECPLCGTALTTDHRRSVVQNYRSTIAELEDEITGLTERIEQHTARRDALRETYREVEAELDELASVPEELATAREQRRAEEEHREEVQQDREQLAALQGQLQEGQFAPAARRRRQALRQKQAELAFDPEQYEKAREMASQVDQYEERLRELSTFAGRKEQLEQNVKQISERAGALREALEEGTTITTLHEDIERLTEQLEDIAFDPDRFDAVRAKLKTLSGIETRMNELKQAVSNRDSWNAQLERLQKRIEAAREEKAALEAKQEAVEEAREKRTAVAEALDEVQAARDEAEDKLQSLQQRRGELTARLEQAQADREDLQSARDEHEEAAQNRTVYKHLRRAFSKHGIPSLIIEDTLPDIEERANALLDRLTDGRMSVRLDTLKEKKSGGTKETLEIIITDEQGVARPYETFSGGEGFRVNFALRIALAQLLAERSGVRIRTLVIDEGFGTQDEDGIERLVEAIRAIQDDFAKIIVITHLSRLKRVFPVRIEVQKDPARGSTFELVGVG